MPLKQHNGMKMAEWTVTGLRSAEEERWLPCRPAGKVRSFTPRGQGSFNPLPALHLLILTCCRSLPGQKNRAFGGIFTLSTE